MLKLFHPSRNFYKYLITTLLVIVPLYPKFPLIKVFGTYVSIRLEDIVIFVAFIFFIPLIIKNIKLLFREKIVRSIALYLIIGGISLISAITITKTVIPHIGILHLLRRFEYLTFFVFGYLYIKEFYKSSDFGYFFKVVGLIIFFAFIYGILQRYFSFPIVITQNYEYSKGIALRWISGSHINSTFAGHYDLASYLVFMLPLFLVGFFVLKTKYTKIFSGFVSLAGYWLLSNAVSRISIVSFLFAVSFSLFLLKKYKEIVIFGAISLVLFGFSSDLRTRYMRIFDVVSEKISMINTVFASEGNVLEDRSTSIRLNVEWPRAIRAFSKNPLLGTGFSSITLATDNDYLRALGEVGILGFLAFSLIFINLSKSFFQKIKTNDLSNIESIFFYSFIGSIMGIFISAFFIDIFEASKFATGYWMIIGIIYGRIS